MGGQLNSNLGLLNFSLFFPFLKVDSECGNMQYLFFTHMQILDLSKIADTGNYYIPFYFSVYTCQYINIVIIYCLIFVHCLSEIKPSALSVIGCIVSPDLHLHSYSCPDLIVRKLDYSTF